jgi:cell shape-determining protein MreD
MGILWDALQGGIIEVATFKMPFIVFVVDSSYHVFVEGSIAGLILALVMKKYPYHYKNVKTD